MAWITPKTNWSSVDFLNYEDLDRIENNTREVADVLSHFSKKPILTHVLNRNMKTIEFASSLNRIEENINQLKDYYRPINWIPMKTDWKDNDIFTYEDANRLEQNLSMLYLFYFGNYSAIPSCGMVSCGEEQI